MVGTFVRFAVAAVLLPTLVFPVLNVLTLPVFLYCLLSGIRRMWRGSAPRQASTPHA